jgi:hypothetical protein
VGHVIALVTHGLAHDQPLATLVQLPDWRKSGLGARLTLGFAIETRATCAFAGTVAAVVALGTTGVVAGEVVVGVGTVVVESVERAGLGTVVVVGSVVGLDVASVCALMVVAWDLVAVVGTPFFTTCAVALTTCFTFTVVVATLEVVTAVVVVPAARAELGCTVANGIANAINASALSEIAIVLVTTWWPRISAAVKRRIAVNETLE